MGYSMFCKINKKNLRKLEAKKLRLKLWMKVRKRTANE